MGLVGCPHRAVPRPAGRGRPRQAARHIGLDLTISPSLPVAAIILCVVLGVGVTLLAAWIPTRRAGKIAPVEALRESVTVREGRGRVRCGRPALLALAAVLYALGIRSDSGATKVLVAGAGAGFVLIVAAVVLAPAAAVLLVRLLPATGGAPGKLARANTVRNPRRTAATAAAITIGVALVTGVTVFASSLNASVGKAVDDGNFRGEYAISAQTQKVSQDLLDKLPLGARGGHHGVPGPVPGPGRRVGGESRWAGRGVHDGVPAEGRRRHGRRDRPGHGHRRRGHREGQEVGGRQQARPDVRRRHPQGVHGGGPLRQVDLRFRACRPIWARSRRWPQAKGVSTAFVTLAPGADAGALRRSSRS